MIRRAILVGLSVVMGLEEWDTLGPQMWLR